MFEADQEDEENSEEPLILLSDPNAEILNVDMDSDTDADTDTDFECLDYFKKENILKKSHTEEKPTEEEKERKSRTDLQRILNLLKELRQYPS